MSTSSSKIHVGMDVHKDTVMIAVLPESAEKPTVVKQLPNDERALRRFLARTARDGELRCCYEASGAGYVLQRAIERWGHECEVIAPALILSRPGHHRKHDRFDAIELAHQHRAGLLVSVRIPSEAEERVRDLVRCRETFQREILKSRHYILKFLRRRGLVFRDGSNWTNKHLRWLRSLLSQEELVAEDRDVLGEYLALLEYKIDRRDELDRRIERIAVTPAYKEAVGRLRGLRGLDTHGAMVLRSELGDLRRFGSPRHLMAYVGLVPREHSSGSRENRGSIRQQSLPTRPRAGGVELPIPATRGRQAQAAAGGTPARCGRPQLEGSASAPQVVPPDRGASWLPHRRCRRRQGTRRLRLGPAPGRRLRDSPSAGQGRMTQ
jgi:transposase